MKKSYNQNQTKDINCNHKLVIEEANRWKWFNQGKNCQYLLIKRSDRIEIEGI
jgi:hypothetical protein